MSIIIIMIFIDMLFLSYAKSKGIFFNSFLYLYFHLHYITITFSLKLECEC